MRTVPRPEPPAARTRWLVGAVSAVVVAACAVAPAFATGSFDRTTAQRAASSDTAQPAAAQTLRFTANNSTTSYKSAPTKAEAGPTTIVFENSEATGNTSGMQHTLTFDTSTPGYNHDVDLDIMAYPDDEKNGRWQEDVVLTKGTYRIHCTIPGHGQMEVELVVTGGGDPGDDTTAPKASAKITGEKNANGAYIGSAEVSVGATDEGGSGVKAIQYQLDDTGWQRYTGPVTVNKIGDHTIGYRATDGAGNKSDEGLKRFKVVKDDGKDNSPPDVDVMLHGKQNSDGAYVGSAKVMLHASDSESGVAKIQYKVDGSAWQKYNDTFAVKKTGRHTLAVRATDKAGNTSDTTSKGFEVVPGSDDDTEAPVATAMVAGEQNADWTYLGKVTVTLDASDKGSGVDTIEYRLDDGDWQAYEKPVAVDSEGEHTADYRATDAAGNTAKAKRATFTIVAEAPDEPACPDPDQSPTVVMGDVNSTVRNREADGSCTIDDLIHDEDRWSSHDAFVSHARSVLGELVEDGMVTAGERTRILDAARRSDVGTAGARRR